MTVEGDILKKLASIKDEIKGLKKVESTDSSTNGRTKDKENIDINNERVNLPSGEEGSATLFLFDATGSMDPLWKETRKIMNEMIERITKVGRVKLKCVAYRDYCDGSRIFERSRWYTEAEPLIDFLSRVVCDGGGDTPEAVEDALKLAYEEKEKVTRVILIGDAPPHSLEDAAYHARNLGKKGIPVFAFLVGKDSTARRSFQQIATVSNGSYGDLRNYKDLLDMMSITIVHDVGGHEAVDKYIKKYGTSDHVKEFSKSLPSYKK